MYNPNYDFYSKKGKDIKIYAITFVITFILGLTFILILYYTGVLPNTLPNYIKESIDFYENLDCTRILTYYISNDYNYSFKKLKMKHFGFKKITDFEIYDHKYKEYAEVIQIRNKILASRINSCINKYISNRNEFYKNLECGLVLEASGRIIEARSSDDSILKKEIQKFFSQKLNFDDVDFILKLDQGGALKNNPKLLWSTELRKNYEEKLKSCLRRAERLYFR
jgi:hypothetical protein